MMMMINISINISILLCTINLISASYVIQYNYLYSSSCTGNLVNIVGYSDQCYLIGGGSGQYICIDGVPTLNVYSESTTCTGTATTLISQSTTCSTTYDPSFNEWISTIWTCSPSLPPNTVVQGQYSDSDCTTLYKFTAATVDQCGYNPNYFYSNMVTCANGVESFSTYSDSSCSIVKSTTNTNVPTACEIMPGTSSYQKTFCNIITSSSIPNDAIDSSTNGNTVSNQQPVSLPDSKGPNVGLIVALVLVAVSIIIISIWYYFYHDSTKNKHHQLLASTDASDTLTHQLINEPINESIQP